MINPKSFFADKEDSAVDAINPYLEGGYFNEALVRQFGLLDLFLF